MGTGVGNGVGIGVGAGDGAGDGLIVTEGINDATFDGIAEKIDVGSIESSANPLSEGPDVGTTDATEDG